MGLVENYIHERFANQDNDAETNAPATPLEAYASGTPSSEAHQPPFAKVNTVAEGSPAAVAGLKPGDEIRAFGYVDSSNHDSLKRVGECVQGSEGVSRKLFPCRISVGLSRSLRRGMRRETYLLEFHERRTTLHGVKNFV